MRHSKPTLKSNSSKAAVTFLSRAGRTQVLSRRQTQARSDLRSTHFSSQSATPNPATSSYSRSQPPTNRPSSNKAGILFL